MDGAAPPPRSGSLPQGHHLSSMSSASGRFLDDLLNEYNYPSAAHSPVLSRSASSQLEPGDSQTPTATEPEHSQGDGGPPKNDLPPLPVNSFGARTDSLRFPPATSPPTSPLPKPPSHPQVPIAVGTQPPKSPNVTQTYPSYRSLERTHMPSEYPTSPHHLNDASHMPRTRARAPSANEPDLSLSARTLPDGQADPKGWLRTPNLRVNLQKRSSDDVATTNDRVKTHSTTGSSITALDHESRDALAMGLNSVPSIPSPEESFGASVAGSIHSKNSISPPKSARSYLSASSPNTASTKSAPYEQSTLTAERWNSDASREKKKGFISHLFGRKKEKSRETDSASDSGPINVRGADRHTPGSDAIDIGNIKAWEDATLGKPIPSFGKKKGAKVQSSTKADKRPQLDLSGFSMDPSFVPLDLVSINSPLSPASARSPYSNSPIGYAHNPAVLPAPLAPPCGPFGAPPPGPSIYLSPATSTWKPPESWGTKVNAAEGRPTGSASAFNGSNKGVLMDRTTTKSIPSLGAPSPDVFDYQDDYSTLSEIRAETDTIRSNHDGLSDERMCTLRLFRRDGTFATISCRESTTAGELLVIMAKKSLIADYSKFNVTIVQKGFERILARTERPLMLQRRLFEQVGYVASDRIELLGREDNSYLCRFVFKEASVGNDVPPDFWRSTNFSTSTVSLARMNLTAVPLTCYRLANDIVSFDLSLNPNVQEIPNDLAVTLESTRLVNMSRNELSKVPRALEFITTLSEINLSHNRIASLVGSGLENVPGLTKLYLAGNLIDHIPDAIPRGCQRLEILDLSNNRFRTFPVDLCHYLGKTLKHLDLNYCRIKDSIPDAIGDLVQLTVLRLAGNRAYGALPWRLGELQQLLELDLRGNSFGNAGGEEVMVMEVLSRCSRLETVLLDANRVRWVGMWSHRPADCSRSSPDRRVEEGSPYLADQDDNEILEIQSLKKLSLGSQFDPSHSRPMGLELSNITGSLAELDIGYCGIEFLPHLFFQRLPGLLKLNLSGNRLRDIPDFMPGPTSADSVKIPLRELYLSNNFLEYLPDDIGELDRLILLEIKGNNIRELPAEIWRCRSLKVLNVSSNRLESFPTPYPEDGTVLVPANNNVTFGRSGGFSFSTSFDRINGAMASSRSANRVDDPYQCENMQTQHNLPPLSHALEYLFLSDNNLGDDIYMALYHMPNLLTLHASFNEFTDITPWVVAIPLPVPMTPWFLKLQELHLSGNLISTLPGEIERIRTLKTLFLNGNKMSTVPGEVGKLKALEGLDLGSQVGGRGEGTGLRYNVSNWPYDWNWNWNLDLKYLNLSGNKRLEIKPSTTASSFLAGSDALPSGNQPNPAAGHKVGARGGAIQAPATSGALVGNPSQRRRDLTDFNALTNLRLLGLMDVTCLIVPPDESMDRRIRTTGSDVPMVGVRGGVVRYGVADVLSRPLGRNFVPSPFSETVPPIQHSLSKESDADTFEVWDLVIPKFRGRDNEALFAVFDGKGTSGGAKMAKYLNEWFGWFLANELERVERAESAAHAELKRDAPSDPMEVHSTFSRSAPTPGTMRNIPNSKRPPLPAEPSERTLAHQTLDPQAIRTALRRTFIAVNRELGSMGDDLDEGLVGPQQNQQQRSSFERHRSDSPRKGSTRAHKGSGGTGVESSPGAAAVRPLYGASAVVVFLYGSTLAAKRGAAKCTMYIANVGDGLAVMSKAGGTANVMSRHHILDLAGLSRAEAKRQQAKLEGRETDEAKAAVDDERSWAHLPWPLSEVERVQSAGGSFSSSGYIEGEVPLTRAFGYFPVIGFVNADPWIHTVELEVGDDATDASRLQQQPMADNPEDLTDITASSLNGGDEFVVLASSAVWNAVRCGGPYDDGAQMVVDIARSALAPSGSGGGSTGASMGGVGMSTGGGGSSLGGSGMTKSASNLASVQQQSGKSTGGWGTAAMKVRDVALSLAGGQVGGGYLVMVLGLRDLAKKSTWWNAAGARRGSAESSIESLNVDDRFRKGVVAGSGDVVKAPRRKGTEEVVDALTKEIAPPIGRLALVFTDIKNSTSIWENNPVAMRAALRLHHSVMRKLLRQTGGYEVKTEGDAFMVSFQNVSNAVEWCLTVQGELLNIDWPSEILGMADGVDVWWQRNGSNEFVTGGMFEGGDAPGAASDVEVEMTDDDVRSPGGVRQAGSGNGSGGGRTFPRKKRELIFKGLSVRMGIHFGNPLCEVDPITSRMDYYGPMVNRAARVTGASQGGQILISSDAMKELKKTLGWWNEESVEGDNLGDEVKGGEDLTDNVGPKPDALQPPPSSSLLSPPGHPNNATQQQTAVSQQTSEEAARLKKLGIVTWCIGEVKLKGLETPEVIYAIYRRELCTRHRFFALEQSGGLNLLTQQPQSQTPSASASQDATSPTSPTANTASTAVAPIAPAPPKLVHIDRGMIRQLRALCVRLEWFASRSGEQWRTPASPIPAPLTNEDWHGDDDDDDEEESPESRAALIRELESLTTRVENAISILHLETTPISRALQSLGAAIETDPNHILRAITMYAEKLEERKQRKRTEQEEKQKRKDARAKKRAQKEAAAAAAGIGEYADGNAGSSSAMAGGSSSRSSSRRRERESRTSPSTAPGSPSTTSPPLSASRQHRTRDRPRTADRHTPSAPAPLGAPSYR